jgi:phage terminase large subunit
MPSTANPFTPFMDRYGPRAGARGPLRFVREVLGLEPDKWQRRVLVAYGAGRRRISIRSCHGPGKTAVAAWCVLHALVTHWPQKGVATAPTAGQLFDGLLAEVKHWLRMLPAPIQDLFEVKADRIVLKAAPESSFFTARTSREEKPEALQGIHSENVLLVADEASGVPEAIFEAAGGSMSGEHATTLLLSNPVRVGGFFYDTHTKLRDMWETVHVCAAHAVAKGERSRFLQSRTYYSYRVSQDFVDDMGRRYGTQSNAYRVRVLGEFPQIGDDTVIPFDLAESAVGRDVFEAPDAACVWGLDVARFGDARSVLAKRTRRKLQPLRVWRNLDLMQLCGAVKAEYDDTVPSQRPKAILVDSIGLGSGVVDRLRELKLPVRGINVSESPAVGAKFRNLRSELWWKCREWLEKRDVSLPPRDHNEDLVLELTTPRYTFMSNGKMQVEGKADMKKRGFVSPDLADAVVLTFAEETSTMMGDGKWASWDKPLYRDLKGVV